MKGLKIREYYADLQKGNHNLFSETGFVWCSSVFGLLMLLIDINITHELEMIQQQLYL